MTYSIGETVNIINPGAAFMPQGQVTCLVYSGREEQLVYRIRCANGAEGFFLPGEIVSEQEMRNVEALQKKG